MTCFCNVEPPRVYKFWIIFATPVNIPKLRHYDNDDDDGRYVYVLQDDEKYCPSMHKEVYYKGKLIAGYPFVRHTIYLFVLTVRHCRVGELRESFYTLMFYTRIQYTRDSGISPSLPPPKHLLFEFSRNLRASPLPSHSTARPPHRRYYWVTYIYNLFCSPSLAGRPPLYPQGLRSWTE